MLLHLAFLVPARIEALDQGRPRVGKEEALQKLDQLIPRQPQNATSLTASEYLTLGPDLDNGRGCS